ncbi:S-adenosyl-L-methionine-dependent methyltransferase [Dacryopinax primogenitus]|uniref:S-adenosyl-L-methionine-dependent methyltransferase n=1 Tax=Dacryopinax primogenitus (strain DJM 731) TaxID=1858805 RepID=M5G6Z2_DACPD|nr:S-adenosyl-L-methionine-dependent methyltransferase [Dacryopinax primogenitus]EJT99527.1 S-adenosyl-L-methionine-dependent methyltransferase [Dacryopinax primogenitus]
MNYWDVVIADPATPPLRPRTVDEPSYHASATSVSRHTLPPRELSNTTYSPVTTSYSPAIPPTSATTSPTPVYAPRPHDSYNNRQQRQHIPQPLISPLPSIIEPASPNTAALVYKRITPYPNLSNLPNSYTGFHPALYPDAPETPLNYNEYVHPIHPHRFHVDQQYPNINEASPARRGRAPSPEEPGYPSRHAGATENRPMKTPPTEAPPAALDPYDDFFEFVAGRQVPRRPCVYGLPIDEEERTRLDIGHQMILRAQPGLFLGPVKDVLECSSGDDRKHILDVGTGNGSWAAEVANLHKNAIVHAIDLIPLSRQLPNNAHFFRQDVNRGISMKSEMYDLVHARNLQLGIPDYPKFIDECARVLKPRGLVNLIEGDWDIFDSDGNPVTLYKNPGWFHWIQAWRGAVMQKNIDLQAPQKTDQWLKDSPYFTDVKATAHWMPVGPWTNDADMNQLGEVVWENLKYLIPSIRPLLTEYYRGDQVTADIIVQHAWAELASPHSHVFMRWRFFWGRRNNRPYHPGGPLPRRLRKGKDKATAPAKSEPSSARA